MTAKPLVLLTGATGFAGSHMLDVLVAAGYRVRIPVRPVSDLRWLPAEGVEPVAADLRETDSLRELVRGVGWIIHYAGVTRVPRPEQFHRINTEGTIRLFAVARDESPDFELFVYISSLAAAGPAPSAERPRREVEAPAPITAYGVSKLEAERWLETNRAPGKRVLILRPPAIYGPRDTALLFLFKLVHRGILPLPAPAHSRLSLVAAQDVAGAGLHLAQRGAEGTYFVADGEFHRWDATARLAARALGVSARAVRIPRLVSGFAGEVGGIWAALTQRTPVINPDKVRDLIEPFWICSIDKLRAEGYEPRIPLERGIPETIAWYRDAGWL